MFDLIFQLVFLVVFLVLGILFLKTIQNTIKLIQPKNREMDPFDVWYMVIPVVNYFYYFRMVKRVRASIQNELTANNSQENPPYITGIIAATSLVLNFIMNTLEKLELLGDQIMLPAFIFLVGFICWIVYWVQVNGWKNKLKAMQVINHNPIAATEESI